MTDRQVRARAVRSTLDASSIFVAFALAAPTLDAQANSPRAAVELLSAISRADAQAASTLLTDDAQLIYGDRCTVAKPCLGRASILAALPPAGEVRVQSSIDLQRSANVWRTSLQVQRDSGSLPASAEIYMRGESVASVIIETRGATTENRAAPGRRAFDWAGTSATTAEELGVGTDRARDRILKSLREGGVAILCRHGNTHWGEQDVFGRNYTAAQRAELNAQRKLNDLGRAEGRAIHDALKMHGVKVSAAFSTWWSRTREFGALIAGFEPTVTDSLGGSPSITGATYQTIVNDAAKRPGITILSAHAEPFTSMNLVRGAPFHEGNCVIMKATSDKSFEVLSHLNPGQWAQLARP